jgi:hypothetical protein
MTWRRFDGSLRILELRLGRVNIYRYQAYTFQKHIVSASKVWMDWCEKECLSPLFRNFDSPPYFSALDLRDAQYIIHQTLLSFSLFFSPGRPQFTLIPAQPMKNAGGHVTQPIFCLGHSTVMI